MKTLFKHPGLGGLLFAQSQVAFNDNATKLVLIGLVQILLPKDEAAQVVSLIALLLVTPFVLLAPMSGWLADRFPKRHVLAASLWLQLAVMIALFAAVALHSIALAVGGFFLLGAQSALMSPARRGMVKELAGDSVGEVVGWMEMFCIAAILAGSLAGGQLIDGMVSVTGSAWSAAGTTFLVLAVTCAISLWLFRRVPTQAPSARVPFTWKTLFGHWELLKGLHATPSIWRAALGDAAFYFAGGVLMLTLAEVGRMLFPDGHGAARVTGIMMATMGGGIAVGSIAAATMCRHQIQMGLVPAAAFLLSGVAFGLSMAMPGSAVFSGLLFVLGVAGGLYLVPLGAFLVDRAPAANRGAILAGSGMLSSVAGVLAVACHGGLKSAFDLGVAGQFVFLGSFFLLTTIFATRMIPSELIRLIALMAARVRYQTTTLGLENLPAKGGVLVVCNHVSYADTILLSMASRRPIRFLSYAGFFQSPVLGGLLRIFGAIPVSSARVREAVVRASEAIARGEVVCIFPEGQLTRTGCLMELKSGFELIARRAGCPVVVAHLDGLWGSIFSFEGGRYFTKVPQGLRRSVRVSFAPALAAAEATAVRVREEMLALGERAFRARACRASLAGELLAALRRSPARICVMDPAGKIASLRSVELATMAMAMARRWRGHGARRVGVILPAGLAGTLVNLGLLFGGKVPVNLNPTLSEEAFQSCVKTAGIDRVVTARGMLKKFPNLPLPGDVRFVEDELRRIGVLEKCRAFVAAVIGQVPNRAADDEAILLFTSGTSGLPKPVSLSNRHVLSNARQILETGFLKNDDRLLSSLPLFHSFGLTVGLLTPLLSGRLLITAPSPLDADALSVAARSGAPTILLSTPTFLRNYARRIPRDAFGTLRMAVAGAERLTSETRELFHARFGCAVYEGYGLTEASPVVSLNQADPELGRGAETLQSGSLAGSVGRLLPGIAVRFLDPDTALPSPGATRGILALRGSNIVGDYAGVTCAEKFSDGWLVTGDMASINPEGFLFLEGRVSRFSKIGGEMVSHAAVEDAMARAFPDVTGTGRHCVLGRPHPEKGEELVLLTTIAVTRKELSDALEVSNLWIPRIIVNVPQMPILATGKLDLAACRRLVESDPIEK